MKGGKIIGIGWRCCGGILGAVGDEEVEEDGGNDCPLGDTRMDFAEGGEGVVVGAGGHSTAEVTGEPADKIGVEGGIGDFGEEEVMGDAVEGFGEVDGCNQGPGGGSFLVEPDGYGGCDLEEGRGGGVEGFKAMLGGVSGEGFFEMREEEAFQDFSCRAKEGDGAVGATGVRRFAGLEEGDYC